MILLLIIFFRTLAIGSFGGLGEITVPLSKEMF